MSATVTSDQGAEIHELHGRVSLLVRGYVVFAVVVILALFALGALIKGVHSTQESHFKDGASERGLIIQQNGEILTALREGRR